MAKRIRMFVFLALSGLLMVAHDQFYTFLRTQIISEDHTDKLLLNKAGIQLLVHAIGTILAYTTKLLLSAAIGTAFIQVFWMRMRRESHTIPEIDAALSSKTNPFGLASLKAWESMFLLAFMPALGVINMQIIVFSTGSISLQFGNTVNNSCELYTVDLSKDVIGPKAQVRGFVTQSIMFDAPLSPEVLDPNTVSYSLNFNAPDLNCTDITSTSNSSQLLPSPPSNSSIHVWNTIYQRGAPGTPITFITASRVAEFDSGAQVVQCVFYNASLSVEINQTDSGIFQSVPVASTPNSILVFGTPDEEVTNGALNSVALADTFASILNGSVVYDPMTSEFDADSSIIAYTPFAEGKAGVPWSFAEADMAVAIPALMRQVSLSLLSGALKSETGSKSLSTITDACTVNALVFKYDQYDRARLLLSYGVGILCTTISVVAGCVAIRVNGVEESIRFSRLLSSLVHPGMCGDMDTLEDPETRLKLEGEKGERGKFILKVVEKPV